jgi:hypothetical protein
MSTETNCPVARLANETKRLWAAYNVADRSSVDENRRRNERTKELLMERIDTNTLLASNLKATSLTGALFQIELIEYFRSVISDDRDEDRDDSEAFDAIERLSYSAAAFLVSIGASREESCAEIYMPRRLDPHAVIDRVLAA